MALRTGHGAGAGVPRIETLPIDELPAAIPVAPEPVVRRTDGTFADSATAKAIGARGGLARHAKARLVSALGLKDIATGAAFSPYSIAGNDFVKQHLISLALQCGGEVGPAPATMVASAAVQLTSSRFLSDQAMATGDADLFIKASRLANDSRQNLLAAYELAIREAQAKRDAKPAVNVLSQWAASDDA